MKPEATKPFYHVTSRGAAEAILATGFEGDWGDAGYGVYLFDNPRDAGLYAARGGWDGGLPDAVIIELHAASSEVEQVLPHPSWPNPDDYRHVRFHPMEEAERWQPAMSVLPDHTMAATHSGMGMEL